MKKTALLLSLLGLLSGVARAQTVPLFINYQGKVTDSAGVGLGTGTPVNRKVLFRLYDATTGGNRLWTEEQTVTLANGEFSVLLGQGVASGTEARPALDTVFTSPGAGRYLGITVDNGDGTLNGADAEITPRQQITTTAFAFRALTADNVASGTDLRMNNSPNYGLGFYGGSRLFAGTNVDGPALYGASGGVLGAVNGTTQTSALRWNAAGQVGIGTLTPTAKLHVRGGKEQVRIESENNQGFAGITTKSLNNVSWSAGSYNNDWQIQDDTGGHTRFAVTRAGNVGIGVDNPTAKLEVDGSIKVRSTSVLELGVGIAGGKHDVAGRIGYKTYTSGLDIVGAGIAADYSDRKVTVFAEGGTTLNGPLGVGLAANTFPTGAKLVVEGSAFINGTVAIKGTNFIELGKDIAGGKENNAGKIGYKLFSTGVDIVGAGTSPTDRKVNIHAEAGTVFTGPVGIGMAADTAITGAKLLVNGAANFQLGAHASMSNNGAGAGGGAAIIGCSIRATDRIVCPIFSTTSDLRMKNRVGRSDGGKDLQSLMGLEVTDYTFKDTIGLGSVPQKKVIAQQVREVLPQAVTAGIGVIPDIYKSAPVRDGWITLDCGLKKGDTVRLNAEGQDGVFEVLEVGEGTFRTSFKPAGGEVFVYGRQVPDFLTVDYDAIAMLNVSATQQIKREKDAEVKALREENSALRAQLDTLTKQVTARAEQDKARDAKLAAIEKLLGERSTFTVSVPATTAPR